MKPSLASLGALALPLALAAAPPELKTQGATTVTITRAPEKRLDFEVLVPASAEDVYRVFTTEDGMKSWLAPAAKVEMKRGGSWDVWLGGADQPPGGGNVLAWVPNEMIAIAAKAPHDKFPTVERERTVAVFRFEPMGRETTRVRLTQIGWQQGEEWDKAFDYLAAGNAFLMNMLRDRFVKGPVDWAKLANPHAPAKSAN